MGLLFAEFLRCERMPRVPNIRNVPPESIMMEIRCGMVRHTIMSKQKAEGTGFEPATGFPASDFESDR